jgi:hypothetical protein
MLTKDIISIVERFAEERRSWDECRQELLNLELIYQRGKNARN